MSEAAQELRSAAIGERIADARRSVGLTQKQFADALGTSIWSVERMEAGTTDPARHVSTIADVTRRHDDWFLHSSKSRDEAPRVVNDATVAHLGGAGRTLVLGSIVLLVTIRFFTEVVPVLPRAANFVDVPILLGLALAASVVPVQSRHRPAYLHVGLPMTAFLILSIASAIVNFHRAAPAPVLVFIYGFLAPMAIYAAAYRIWPPGNSRSLSRLLVGLGLLQLVVVAVFGLPQFVTSGNPDVISGTFGTNQYQLVFFLLVIVVLLVGIFTLEPQSIISRFIPIIIPAVFAVMLLAQYRALLATIVVTIAVVGILLGRHARGVLASIGAVVALAMTFSYVASSFPGLKLGPTASTLSQSPWSYVARRYEATRPVAELYRDDQFVGAIGTGPGTFSSRAWQTFAQADSTSHSNVQGGYAQLLTGGLYTTDVSQKYVVPQVDKGELTEGSAGLSKPYSSYLGLLAEVGLLGLLLIVAVYVRALVHTARIAHVQIAGTSSDDSVPALALATTVGFLALLQMAVLENWLESARVTFVVWLMFGVVSKELDSRSFSHT